jgi:hypothetical protein
MSENHAPLEAAIAIAPCRTTHWACACVLDRLNAAEAALADAEYRASTALGSLAKAEALHVECGEALREAEADAERTEREWERARRAAQARVGLIQDYAIEGERLRRERQDILAERDTLRECLAKAEGERDAAYSHLHDAAQIVDGLEGERDEARRRLEVAGHLVADLMVERNAAMKAANHDALRSHMFQADADLLRGQLRDAREDGLKAAAIYEECILKWNDEGQRLRERVRRLEAVLDSPELLESLAALEHERWSGWMEYQERRRCDIHPDTLEPFPERWARQAATSYQLLSWREKESDRVEVRKTLALIRAALAAVECAESRTSGGCESNLATIMFDAENAKGEPQ